MPPLARCAASAAPLVRAITSSDVPTAIAIGKPSPSVSAGTITKPPPTPKKPVRRPVAAPAAPTRGRTRRCAETLVAGARGGRAIPYAAASSSTREADEDRRGLDEPVQRRARDRRDRAGRGEREPDAPHDAVVACGGERPDQRGQADDQQRLGRRLLDGLAEHVDEHRHGEDRAAGADEAEQDADREAERHREQRVAHRPLSRPRRARCPGRAGPRRCRRRRARGSRRRGAAAARPRASCGCRPSRRPRAARAALAGWPSERALRRPPASSW